MRAPVHQHTDYGCRVIAASLILTAYWSGRTAHSEFSWLKSRERNQWMGCCCTEAKKGPNRSCEARGFRLPLSHSVTIAFSHLFSLSLSRQDTFSFILYSTCTVNNTWVFFSSQTVGYRKPQLKQPPCLLSTCLHRWVQMDTKPQTWQHNRNFSIYGCQSKFLI